ncbi:KAP family P-loop NTPase fold protein [Aeromonas caviae]
MLHSLMKNAKYASWQESHTFDNCKLNRKDYGQFLANYLIGEKDGFVLNLNGSWGTGKTEFLKRFYVELMDRGHPTIYIDAWESDFSQEPLTVVASELLSQLERLTEGAISDGVVAEVKRALGKVLKGTLVGFAGLVSAKLLNDASIGMEATNKVLEEAPQNITERLAKDYHNQIDAISRVRKALGDLSESLKMVNGSSLPVIVLIDELDRCRPTYAIEMLEVIKHFFSIKNFVFVIATDTEQLCHSITSIYGDEFDSSQYLKRFFNRKSSLPTPNIDEYLSTKIDKNISYTSVYVYPELGKTPTLSKNIALNIAYLAAAYHLKIRDVDQLLDKVYSCLRTISHIATSKKTSQHVNIGALIVGLIEQDFNMDSYHKRRDYQPFITPPLEDTKLSDDMAVSLYIKLCTESVLLKENHQDGVYGHSIYRAPPTREHYNDIKRQGASSLQSQVLYSLASLADRYEGQNIKYWLWSDMKSLIELAGTFE